MISLANLQLTLHVSERKFKHLSPTNDVVDDDLRIRIVIYRHTAFLSKFLPDAVDVMNEVDEGCRPIGRPKWHDHIGHLMALTP
jgi:hypothetical protein